MNESTNQFNPSASQPVDPTALSLTDSAAQKVRRLREEEGDSELMLRDVTLVVDSLSYQYLQGSTVDYTEGLEGARFVVANPNATTSCGCGSSFSI